MNTQACPNKLHLGCGKNHIDGWLNVDIVPLPGVDMDWDLTQRPWPFASNSVNEIRAYHVLEHLDDIKKTLEEMWRVCSNGAIIDIQVPIWPSVASFGDPTHRVCYSYYSFDYFTKGFMFEYYSHAKFEIVSKRIIFMSVIRKRFPNWIGIDTMFVNSHPLIQKIWFNLFAFFYSAEQLHVILKAIKEN